MESNNAHCGDSTHSQKHSCCGGESKDSNHVDSKNHAQDSKNTESNHDKNAKKSPFSFFHNIFKKKGGTQTTNNTQDSKKTQDNEPIYKDNRKVIALNFPLLNFKENYGSFAVFAAAAGLDSKDLSQNEIIIDVDATFLINCLCLYAPFILEELTNSPEMQAYERVDSEAFKGFKERGEKLINFLTKFLNNEFEGLKVSEAFRNEAVLSAIIYLSDFNLTLGKTHKNIQLIFEILKVIYGNSLLDSRNDEFYKYQFIAFNEDKKSESLQVAYAKLHALSKGAAPLRSLNLDSIFGLFPNLAWSGNTPYELEYLRENEIEWRVNGRFPVIDYIDKFPRYLMQVLPQADNIRILDTSKTRFGAFLGAGYTQMPGASYVNFNSGSLGACMNEGRISSSVVIGEGTDVGGGASILGVLSGGNTQPISIGKNCLLGANSVTGISLGDSCIVDAGIAILAGGKVFIEPAEAAKLKEVNKDFVIESSNIYKGRNLSGMNGIHFRINTQNGQLIAFRSNREIKLNADLH
ncbi:dapD [Helicobacter saguini]|uniref:DapD n=1 Tax=Helicobacter saguini TaxID=1548018 RepID=A0A347VMA0_9HELI|nr:dapD [Helicobacter saguini]MWV66883.1 dapD [Helicobacter saguini]MWV69232.1 dapD [Helicobacter saguini]MWV71213.1 dapD [Helicobacter saguini]TLD93345.1 dapD [Helicobacter saguini]